MAATFTIPTGPGGAQAPVSEAQFKAYWHDRFNSDPRMQAIRDRPRMSEQSKANSGRALATDMGWIPPDNSWQIDFDKKEGMRTEQDSFFTRHETAITAAALGGVAGAGAIAGAGAAGAGGAGAAGAIPSTAIPGVTAGANLGALGTTGVTLGGAGAAGAGAAGAGGAAGGGGAAAGGGGTLATLGRFAGPASKYVGGIISGRAEGRKAEIDAQAKDALTRENAAITQATLYNQAVRDNIRAKLLSEPPIDYASMVPANVRAFSGASPVDTSKNPALGKQLADNAAPVIARGRPTFDASKLPPSPTAGKADTILNIIGMGLGALDTYNTATGGGGTGGSAPRSTGTNPLSGATQSPADFAAEQATRASANMAPPDESVMGGATFGPAPPDRGIMSGVHFDPYQSNTESFRWPSSGNDLMSGVTLPAYSSANTRAPSPAPAPSLNFSDSLSGRTPPAQPSGVNFSDYLSSGRTPPALPPYTPAGRPSPSPGVDLSTDPYLHPNLIRDLLDPNGRIDPNQLYRARRSF